ncbi:MAG: RNA 2',3'-cyclic phosphodiesterase [Chloroflexi bacterium]|jgi:RNA 2',3'-cyclic 3'-phosphodiesterase|nr:RNA 2',3'-cyclic phosphodiesterase [Chloroflexota bacterium]MBT3670786.1 RNA 2',3'-cyclic phosphodiesterase [Chloroflexota bacterium]MBT4002089.1 RNA 2',3'-cyclic phosphodiesterase [Chloroflexota bacterium]MBT4305154.1 RNA 2',3'-cyclic phosphodiesterase [Chloroflexota bacterium]MBT4533324.1 RNA 2',3'-cyclic phosphodiesterase [Chloroflexota bacterium]
MAAIRSFIAIELPAELQKSLQTVHDHLFEELKGLPIRWVPIPNIHITLKFLGDVSENNIPMINEIIQKAASNSKPLDITAGGFGIFPNVTRPRVIWVGIKAPEELFKLQARTEIETSKMGYSPDQRKFNPHLTMGRVSRNATIQEIRTASNIFRKQKFGFIGAAKINSISLYQSKLSPKGAIYKKLFTANLGS